MPITMARWTIGETYPGFPLNIDSTETFFNFLYLILGSQKFLGQWFALKKIHLFRKTLKFDKIFNDIYSVFL